MKKISEKIIYKFIINFNKRYNQVPCTGFLAGYYKVTIHTIYRKLNELEKQGKIKRVKKEKNNTSYKII